MFSTLKGHRSLARQSRIVIINLAVYDIERYQKVFFPKEAAVVTKDL